MFTGIIEETGVVESIQPGPRSIELVVRAQLCGRGAKAGESLAVNGCCLTMVRIRQRAKYKSIGLDLLKETWTRTNLSSAQVGDLVNLERSLSPGGRMGGHFVTGHIDGVGIIRRWEPVGQDYLLEVSAPPEVMRYVVFKGSIAVDGISLTVAGVNRRGFTIWIIPHTREVTALQARKVGDRVNLEADLLGKYVEKFVAIRKR